MNYVEPITDIRKIQAMSEYLKKSNRRDYIMFILGINVGLRISDMIDKTVGFFARSAEIGFIELVPKKTDKSKEAKARRKGVVEAWSNDIGIVEEEQAEAVNNGGYRRKKVRIYMSDDVIELIKKKQPIGIRTSTCSNQGTAPWDLSLLLGKEHTICLMTRLEPLGLKTLSVRIACVRLSGIGTTRRIEIYVC